MRRWFWNVRFSCWIAYYCGPAFGFGLAWKLAQADDTSFNEGVSPKDAALDEIEAMYR